MVDVQYLSRFPFLHEAREYVKAGRVTMADMLDEKNVHIQKRSMERILDSIEGKDIEKVQGLGIDEEAELLSYPVARFMVAAVGDLNLIKWFSHHEAERGRYYLEKEPADNLVSIGKELGFETHKEPPGKQTDHPSLSRVVKGVRPAGDRMMGERRSYWIRFTDYLPPKRNISGPEWDLINQTMTDGYIELNHHEYVRLLQEMIKRKVEDGLASQVRLPKNRKLLEMINTLKKKIEGRKKKYAPTELGRLTVTRLPPCIRQILGMSQAGENLPHHARFALVTFLHAAGQSPDNIFKVFSSAPDFKEDIVRYQIDHITGSSSATNYYVPNCETMKSGGICYNPDKLCEKEWMTNPMKYYRIKGKPRESRKGAPSSS